MRRLYDEFFYIPKHKKIREKVMIARVTLTVVIVLFCLAAMSFTAYAHFLYNITSGSNVIKAANFETDVLIEATDVNGNSIDVEITKNSDNSNIAKLKVGVEYIVTVSPSVNSLAKTGFVVIKSDACPNTYYTQQLGVDISLDNKMVDSVTFNLTVTADADVVFVPHWGTSSYYDAYKTTGENPELFITQNEEIQLNINTEPQPVV